MFRKRKYILKAKDENGKMYILKKFNLVQEAISYAIENKIECYMIGREESWIKKIKKG